MSLKMQLNKTTPNLTGRLFGRLTVDAFAGYQNRRASWTVTCICGNSITVLAQSLRSGATRSCGCLFTDIRTEQKNGKHCNSRVSATYRSWNGMKQRCLNPNNDRYKDYGGRGIRVCERWLIYQNFVSDMGERPNGTSIERRDNNGNYEPDNCYWATPAEQYANRRNSHYIEFNGIRMTLTQWARRLNIHPNTLTKRLRNRPTGHALTA